ncbi:hypothetical protein H5R88_01950 [Limosilactobacillus sp. WF-MT5-A]|uniref:hypothetical protein n=1 Tax=Limosilactobacillus agrestis TaxID=2759748 RepID=UPI0015F8063F|nr:hypothetical protein [Limosilactobacillus agrestis]MBB1098889.1 hypothetical protein [Limosilactobacillus agrestis]MCD7125681.1 hypothetical protein [Limosilactobacillus agrestis]
MPKQGHFAKSIRTKQLNDFKVKRNATGAIIDDEQLTDFLVVRFALTAKKRVQSGAQETVQRFLIEICDSLQEDNGDLQVIIPNLLMSLNARVPWQFYPAILEEWDLLQKFLQKELPAVPLKKRLRIRRIVTTQEMETLIAKLLVRKITAITFIKQPGADQNRKDQMATMMLTTIYHEQTIEWDKVRLLLAPFKFEIAPDLDEETKGWLKKLAEK